MSVFPPPQHQDGQIRPGMTFYWEEAFDDLDLTGYTATLTIYGLTTDSVTTVTMTDCGPLVNSTLDTVIANSVTSTWLPGVYPYEAVLTAPSGATAIAGYGEIMVRTAPNACPGTGPSNFYGVTDSGAGATITLLINVRSWNRSNPSSGTNIYNLPADTVAQGHRIGWYGGLAPVVNAPAGWQMRNPLTGALVTSYTYAQGIGESYNWMADVTDHVFEPTG